MANFTKITSVNLTGRFIGVLNIANKIKEFYVGIANIARRVKEIYVGINGTARKVVPNGTVTIPALTYDRYSGVCSDNIYSDNVIVAGGTTSTVVIEKYNQNYTKSTSSSLTYYATRQAGSRSQSSSTVLIGGGIYSTTYRSNVCSITTYGTVSSLQELTTPVSNLAACGTTDVIYFAGGYDGSSYSDQVVAYRNGTKTIPSQQFTSGRSDIGASQVGAGKYAIFFCGKISSSSGCASVDAYDNSMTKTSAPEHSVGGFAAAGSSTESVAIFSGVNRTSTVSAGGYSLYDEYLTKTSVSGSITGYCSASGTSSFVLFFGGKGSNSYTVYSVSSSGTTTAEENASSSNLGKQQALGGSLRSQETALFFGGYVYNKGTCTDVEAYKSKY